MRVLIVLLLMGAPAMAQEVMDGTEANVRADRLEELYDALRLKLRDGYSARLSELATTGTGAVCGLVNGKNAYGAYAGNERFMLSHTSLTVGIEPPGSALHDLQRMAFELAGCPWR